MKLADHTEVYTNVSVWIFIRVKKSQKKNQH